MRFFSILAAAGALAVSATALHADVSYSSRTIPAVKTESAPVIDGDISDAQWSAAAKADVFIDPQAGKPVADQTTAYILYDSTNIYVAFQARDSQPARITARESIQDYRFGSFNFDSTSEDAVEVGFDPFNTHKGPDRSIFAVNAIGTQSCAMGGGRGGKREWKGAWQAAVKRVPDGWTAEMRIPWSVLNYPSSKEPATLGINFARTQERTRIYSLWSDLGPNFRFDRDGQWTGVELPAGAFQRRLSLLPYILPGMGSESTLRAGMDARYGFTPQLTAVTAINPDFGTIEGAVEGIQFSRSERFIPERRPFFLEGGNYFRGIGIDAIGPKFYSGRIQTFDLGTKLYGKISPKDTIGFLHALDYGDRSDLITRYTRNLSANSQAGAMFIQKTTPGDNNTVGIVDANLRSGHWQFVPEISLSTGHSAGGHAQQYNGGFSDGRWSFFGGYVDVSPRFRDADGLVFFNDYRGFIQQSFWFNQWRSGPLRELWASVTPMYFWHYNGKPFRRGLEADMGFDTRSDWGFRLSFNDSKFDDQRDRTYGFSITRNVSNRFKRIGIEVQTGTLADRPSTYVGPTFSLRVLRKLDISYGGAIQNLDGRTQQHVATFNYELTPTRSIGGRIVTQDADTNWYCSFRNSGILGTETYLILGDPNARRFVSQGMMKMVFAL